MQYDLNWLGRVRGRQAYQCRSMLSCRLKKIRAERSRPVGSAHEVIRQTDPPGRPLSLKLSNPAGSSKGEGEDLS